MSNQSEALRLAAELEACPSINYKTHAAELRRLHGLDFALRDCELALNKMATKYMDASDQRDALLAALNKIAAIENQMFGPDWGEIDEAREIARAATKAVEGEKT